MLVSLPYSHFTGGMKWNISCHTNKQICHNFLQSQPPKCEFLSHPGKQPIIYAYNNKSGKIRVKVTEAEPFPVTLSHRKRQQPHSSWKSLWPTCPQKACLRCNCANKSAGTVGSAVWSQAKPPLIYKCPLPKQEHWERRIMPENMQELKTSFIVLTEEYK